MKRASLLLMTTPLLLASCSLAPKTVLPAPPVPQSWPVGDAYLLQSEEALPAGRWTRLRWTAPPATGLRFTLDAAPTGALQLRWAAEFDRWPSGVAAPSQPPAEVMATGRSGMTLVTGSRRLAW